MAEKSEKSTLKIVLTPKQREQVQQATGKNVEALKLDPEQLEERIAPMIVC
jgi:hypothetical protein